MEALLCSYNSFLFKFINPNTKQRLEFFFQQLLKIILFTAVFCLLIDWKSLDQGLISNTNVKFIIIIATVSANDAVSVISKSCNISYVRVLLIYWSRRIFPSCIRNSPCIRFFPCYVPYSLRNRDFLPTTCLIIESF